MNKSGVLAVTLIIALLLSVTTVSIEASAPSLADQIKTTINTVNWSSPQSWIIPHFSLIFTGQNTYDAVLPTISDFKTLIQTKRIAELDDVNSSLLDQLVTQAMASQQMVGHWPNVDPHIMCVYYKFLVSAYRYALELGVNSSSWNRDLAYQEFLNCWQADPNFLWFDPAQGIPTDHMDRYYDENAEVLSFFLKFDEIGVPDALNYANQMWTHLCTKHWSGSYFPYIGSSGQVECEAGAFAETIGELYANNMNGLPNFPDYILKDLDYKFLSGGNWSAKLWSPGAYVVRHAESNPEKRLENTITAWAAMQSYYGLMNSTMKSEFDSLLTGSPSAWAGLVDDSNMYNNGQFRWRETSNYTDDATAGGAMLLFLNGIVPDSGSLAIPVIDEVYQDWYSMFPASHFRFDYDSRMIRIPVWAGRINFTFGTGTASYVFPKNGIYEVNFSPDWNTVTNASLVSPLSSRFAYLNPVPVDIAITNLAVSKSVIGQGNLSTVNVTLSSQGILNNETLNLTVCANSTTIYSQPITLVATASSALGFEWNTTGFSYGNYTINAYVEPLPGETNVANNNFTCNSPVHIGIPGDISGFTPGTSDGICNMRDIGCLIAHFNTHLGSLNWNPNCDIDSSGRVDMKDITIAVMNFNKHE
jgi:hypothetical protein